MTQQTEPLLPGSTKIVGIRRPNGHVEAKEFLDGQSDRAAGQFDRMLAYLEDGRRLTNKEKFRHLDNAKDGAQVWEMKVHADGGQRLYLVSDGHGRWFGTHGTQKVPDKQVPAQIKKALSIYSTWKDNK